MFCDLGLRARETQLNSDRALRPVTEELQSNIAMRRLAFLQRALEEPLAKYRRPLKQGNLTIVNSLPSGPIPRNLAVRAFRI